MPPKASTELAFQNPEEAENLIKRVRRDDDELAWVVFNYESNSDNILVVHSSGTSGIEEFQEQFDENERQYGLLRVEDIYDGHTTIKFIFVAWAGSNVRVVRKARMTTHKGSIVQLIGQAHVTIDASEKADIESVMGRVADASGSGNRVLSENRAPSASSSHSAPAPKAAAERPAQSSSSSESQGHSEETRSVSKPAQSKPATSRGGPSVPKESSDLSFVDREGGEKAIARVRSNDDPADWVLFGYQGESNALELIGVGEGGIEALKEKLSPTSINYGVVRLYDFYDGHRTTKFVLILWVGEKVRVVRKARITTHKGAVVEFIGQYHVDISAANVSELNEDIIMTTVRNASGTAVHVI